MFSVTADLKYSSRVLSGFRDPSKTAGVSRFRFLFQLSFDTNVSNRDYGRITPNNRTIPGSAPENNSASRYTKPRSIGKWIETYCGAPTKTGVEQDSTRITAYLSIGPFVGMAMPSLSGTPPIDGWATALRSLW